MGQKVNYNKNKTNKLKLIAIIILAILVVLILIKSVRDVVQNLPSNSQDSENKALVYKSVSEYQTLEELINSYSCKFIKKEETQSLAKIYLNFDVELYTGNSSNETHFLNICKAVAEFVKYKNFELIDESKDIDIEVKCEGTDIIEFKINGDVNYYLNHNSAKNRNLSTTVTNFTIQSPELQELIDGNWNESNVNWGNKNTTCDNYYIYFEEGIKYRNVSRNVFNVVFTEKYTNPVAGGLSPTSSAEAVESALGAPTFSKEKDIYGYLGNDNYLFFDFLNKQISVYPVVNVTEEEESKLKELIATMNSTLDIKTFAVDLTGAWGDYDLYSYDSNYVDLRYTLKGVEVSIHGDSLKNGIYIYQNYAGNRDITDLENVYMQETDCVFEVETDRAMTEAMCRIDQGDFTDEYYSKFLGTDFSVKFKDVNGNKFVGPTFYSRDRSYSDSELDKRLEISSYIWLNEYIFIYSVDGEGIYAYNCIARQTQKIFESDSEIIINDVEDNQIIYNDTERLTIVIE